MLSLVLGGYYKSFKMTPTPASFLTFGHRMRDNPYEVGFPSVIFGGLYGFFFVVKIDGKKCVSHQFLYNYGIYFQACQLLSYEFHETNRLVLLKSVDYLIILRLS